MGGRRLRDKNSEAAVEIIEKVGGFLVPLIFLLAGIPDKKGRE